GMAERRMAEVVGEAQRLGEVLVEAEGARHAPADLRDFDRMSQAHPEMVAVGGDENLSLVAQAAEGDAVDDPVAVALEYVAGDARAAIRFSKGPAARLRGLRGERCDHSFAILLTSCPSGAVQL